MIALCPLCGGEELSHATSGGRRCYDCSQCGLLSVAPPDLPSPALEREQYDLHENEPADERYRAFLRQLTEPLCDKLAPAAEGLDFGCGPGPAIQPMLAEAGFSVANYDPIYAPERAALARRYDFVTATEVVEHFHHPGAAWAQLDELLRPGAWLGVMTLLLQDNTDLARWSYARDPTHVAFYRPRTLQWISDRYGWRLESDGIRVALFRKPPC